LTFSNNTKYAAQAFPFFDRTGRDVVVAVVKASFRIDERGEARLLSKQAPIRPVDEAWDAENPLSSVKLPGDLADRKLGTDVVVIGDAVAPEPVTVLDIGVTVGSRTVPLRVHGPRLFAKRLGGIGITPSVPFHRQPVRYELAFGGASEDWSDVELRNPSGVGIAKRQSDLDGRPAPQIEHPERPHTSGTDRHPPAGFGAVGTHWSPRREFFGTADEFWQQNRCPIFPKDFDIRYYSVAHPALWFEEPVAPGTRVGIVGMSEERVLSFCVPELPISIGARYDNGSEQQRPRIDTLVMQPNDRLIEVVARAAFPLGRRNVLRELRADVLPRSS
jgi:hypothetical protein